MNREQRQEKEEELYLRLKAAAEAIIDRIENRDEYEDVIDLIDEIGGDINEIEFNLLELRNYVDNA